MTDWLGRLNEVLKEASETAGLPRPVEGSDGDGWAWIWRKYLGEGNDQRVAEAVFRARADALGEGVETEVSADAWMEKHREVAWARTYSTQFVDSAAFGSAELRSHLEAQLRDLPRAFSDAQRYASRLQEINQRRNWARGKFKERGLL